MGADPIAQPGGRGTAGTVAGRDRYALRWVGEQYACRADHLAQLLVRLGEPGAVSKPWIRTRVAGWERLGLVEQASVLTGEPPWIWLTRQGLSQVGLTFRVWRPKAWMLAHVAATNQVRLFIEPRRPGALWVPERELRHRALHQPVPDAEIHDDTGTVTAVEVELSPKSTERRRRVMQELVAHYDSVWYFAAAAAWAAVHDALCAVPVQLTHLVRIYALEDC
ncbi:MAG TPA: hypothetical protein VHA57_13215 [Actinomycetota bacterium]|nr:hypothetical protein [Actinomycetota bacterium]